MPRGKALLVIDFQRDFCSGGSLPVAGADSIVPRVNDYINLFATEGLPIFASRDWHPRITGHFKKDGGKWPAHCVEHTEGAEFHPDLNLSSDVIIMTKGTDPREDAYSVFQAFDPEGTSFFDRLRDEGIEELFVAGLATDYCVKHTVHDALALGFKVNLLVDAVRGVDRRDSEKALKSMRTEGAQDWNLSQIHDVLEEEHQPQRSST